MGRKQKHPEHKTLATILMNTLLDELVAAWEDEPELKKMTELSSVKI